MRYRIRGVNAQAHMDSCVVDALDEAHARGQAHERGWLPVDVTPEIAGRWPGSARFDLLLFTQEWLALLDAGLSAVEALDTLVDRAGDAVASRVVSQLAQTARQGLRLADALAQQPDVFPPLFVGLVRAAEGTGELPEMLRRYMAYDLRLRGLRDRLVGAAIYPVILGLVGLAVTGFLLGHVVPSFASVYQGSGRPMPWASASLLAAGRWVGEWRTAIAMGMLAAGALTGHWAWRAWQTGGWLMWLAAVPGMKPRVDRMVLSRLYLTLGLLLQAGMALQTTLTLASAVLPADWRTRLEAVRLKTPTGVALSDALQAQQLVTPVALRLIRVGEQTGQLGVMLGRAAAFHDDEANRWIERFSRAVEPLLMTAIGAVVGLIVILLYMPIFDLVGSL